MNKIFSKDLQLFGYNIMFFITFIIEIYKIGSEFTAEFSFYLPNIVMISYLNICEENQVVILEFYRLI